MKFKPGAVLPGQVGLQLRLQLRRQAPWRFPRVAVRRATSSFTSRENARDRHITARLVLRSRSRTACRTRFSSSTPLHHATAEQLRGRRAGLVWKFSSVLLEDQAANWRRVSSARRCWSSGVRTLPVTWLVVWTTSVPTSRSQFGQHPAAFQGGGFARLGDDLLGLGDGLLRFLFLHAGGGGAGFFNQSCWPGHWPCPEPPVAWLRCGPVPALILSALARPSAMRWRRSSRTLRIGL